MNRRASWMALSARDKLREHRARWAAKPALVELYRHQIFRRILDHRAKGGPDVELGAGGGFYSSHVPQTITTDIVPVDWIDVVCDATRLPLAGSSVRNLVAIDLLHHLPRPGRLLDEAARVLGPGGRLLLVDPWLSPAGTLFYRHAHHEPCDPREDPFAAATDGRPDPFDANAARPWLLFARHRAQLQRRWPGLSLRVLEPFGGPCWILSGGFRRWGLLPAWAVKPVLALEEPLLRPLGPLLALRVLVVLERTG